MKKWNTGVFIAQLLGHTLITILAIKIVATNVNSSLWWMGFVLALPALVWMNTFVWKGLDASQKLGPARLNLNLGEPGVLRPVTLRAILCLLGLATAFPFVFKEELAMAVKSVGNALKRDTNTMRIEYPAYLEKQALEVEFSGQTIDIDTGALLQLQLQDLSAKAQITGSGLQAQFLDHSEALSVSGLYQRLNLKLEQSATLTVTAMVGDKNRGELTLNIAPVPRPIVTLEKRNGPSNEILIFTAQADSTIPMSNVTLDVRTKSGFRFSRTLAEFANSQQHEFKTESAQVSTIGIPFTAQDSLFVKAVARTVVMNISGESPEIEIKITTPQEIREEILKDLTATMDSLKKQDPLAAIKADVQKRLSKANTAAQELGRMSPVKKHIANALELAQNMQQERQRKDVARSVKRAIDALQKEKSKEQATNLFARLQSLKRTVSSQENADMSKLSSDAGALASEFEQLKDQTRTNAKQDTTLLEPAELQSLQNALQRDKTPELLKEAEQKLKEQNRPGADAALSNALQQATANIGEAARIMEMAKARAMQKARKKLSAADAQLQDAKEAESSEPALDQAKESLSQMPKISEEFGEHSDEALKYAKKARTDKSKQPSIEKSQESIVKALEALQDEEDTQKESDQQREESSRNLEVLMIQGQTDTNWRKKILDEIARLRANGTAADAPMIQYFEDQLR